MILGIKQCRQSGRWLVEVKTMDGGGEIEPDGHARCRALGRILDRVGDKWTIMVIGVLSAGPVRFNALQRRIGAVSHRMLTLTLRGLEADGLVTRTIYPTIPPKVEYALTDLGFGLTAPLRALMVWAMENQPRLDAARRLYDLREGDAPRAGPGARRAAEVENS